MMYNCTVIESKQQEVVIPTIIRIIPRLAFLEQVTRKGNQEIMQKGESEWKVAGLRCCHPSRVNDEDWIDLPSSCWPIFPPKIRLFVFFHFFHEELHFCFNSSGFPFS